MYDFDVDIFLDELEFRVKDMEYDEARMIYDILQKKIDTFLNCTVCKEPVSVRGLCKKCYNRHHYITKKKYVPRRQTQR